MTPRIGIATSSAATASARRYAAAVEAAGGQPVWIEPASMTDAVQVAQALADLDGLLLSGGRDIPPHHYGEEMVPGVGVDVDAARYDAEIPLARAATAAGLPVLGICGGLQAMNVAAGGSLYQDLSLMEGVNPSTHRVPGGLPAHPVHVAPDSALWPLMEGLVAEVNSSHHQAIKTLGAGFVVTAVAPDGVIEAIEAPAKRFVVGVQWHPERMVDRDLHQRQLFEALIAASQR